MFCNYLIVAVRHLLRQKLYAFINVFGLAVGLACCILIFLYVRHEWQYDAFHENADRIFRVIVQETRPDGSVGYSTLHPTTFAASLKEEFPGVERASGFIRCTGRKYHIRRSSFENPSAWWNRTFCEMFSFPLLAGDAASRPLRTSGWRGVMSETVARTLYGNPEDAIIQSALGESTAAGSTTNLPSRVSCGTSPRTSSLNFSLLIPIEIPQRTMGLILRLG